MSIFWNYSISKDREHYFAQWEGPVDTAEPFEKVTVAVALKHSGIDALVSRGFLLWRIPTPPASERAAISRR